MRYFRTAAVLQVACLAAGTAALFLSHWLGVNGWIDAALGFAVWWGTLLYSGRRWDVKLGAVSRASGPHCAICGQLLPQPAARCPRCGSDAARNPDLWKGGASW